MTTMLEALLPYTPILALVVRVWVGANLMIHGYPKLKSIETAKKYAGAMGAPAGSAYLVTILEFFGGLFLIIGLIVPVVGLFMVLQFAAITLSKRLKMKGAYISGQNPVKYEVDVLYLILGLVLVVLGAGALSVDMLLGL
jgi:uncharacterized membrane protein YphA (DoxX/SURF4 family)